MPDGLRLSRAPGSASRLERLAVLVATLGPVGRVPVAPGTAGSAVAALFLWVVPLPAPAHAAWLAAVVVVGTWAAHRAAPALGAKDPGAIVIDEVAGMTLTMLTVPITPATLVTGFLLFRAFDVVKPPPARASQAIPGGVGVVIDDLVAGLYAFLALAAVRVVLGWP